MHRPFMYQRSKQNESKKNQKKGEEKMGIYEELQARGLIAQMKKR